MNRTFGFVGTEHDVTTADQQCHGVNVKPHD